MAPAGVDVTTIASMKHSSPALDAGAMPATEPTQMPSLASQDSASEGRSALTRLLQILDLFTVEHPKIHVDEVVAAFAVGQSTAYRYLKELGDAGLISSVGKGFYALGRRIVELERLLQQSDPLLLAGKPVLEALQPYCANRAFLLCTPYNDRVLCVYKVGASDILQSGKSMPIQRGRGTTYPLFQGAGSQAILAHMLPHQIKSLFLTCPQEIVAAGLGATWKEFRTALNAIRKLGYAHSTGRVNPGMYSLAVPILKADTRVAGSILMLSAAEQAEESVALLPMLQKKAQAIAGVLDIFENAASVEV